MLNIYSKHVPNRITVKVTITSIIRKPVKVMHSDDNGFPQNGLSSNLFIFHGIFSIIYDPMLLKSDYY